MLEACDTHHAVHVLRLKAGDTVQAAYDGIWYHCVITHISDNGVFVKAERSLPSTEPQRRITLYQGLVSTEKMDWIVQKATELGAERIIPLLMRRCIIKPRGDQADKTRRWQKIAREAAKQSGRAFVPVIEPLRFPPYPEFTHDLLIAPWEEAQTLSLPQLALHNPNAISIGVLIGPEGGMEREEVLSLPFTPVSLGPRILRTETAGITALSVLFALYGDMERNDVT